MKYENITLADALDNLEGDWVRLDAGLRRTYPELRQQVGLYRFRLDGQIMGLGCGTEYQNGGLAKRLRDFVREGDSGRKHYLGQQAYEHRGEVEVEVLVLGSDQAAAWTAKDLKLAYLKQHLPQWNVAPSRVEAALELTRQAAKRMRAAKNAPSAPSAKSQPARQSVTRRAKLGS